MGKARQMRRVVEDLGMVPGVWYAEDADGNEVPVDGCLADLLSKMAEKQCPICSEGVQHGGQ